jgi:8-oxo-dGTP diphosphatase
MRPCVGRAALAAQASESLRVRVAAVLILDGRIVLVRHRKAEHAYHLLPGGGVEAGETLHEALIREVAEETGLAIDVARPLFISETIDPRGGRHLINVTFLGTVTGGEITSRPLDPRVEAVDLVTPEALAGLDMRPPIAAALSEAYADGFAQDTRYLGSLWVEEPTSHEGVSDTPG